MAIHCQLGDAVFSAPQAEFSPWSGDLFSHDGDWEMRRLLARWERRWRLCSGEEIDNPRLEPGDERDELYLVAIDDDGEEWEAGRTQTGFELLYADDQKGFSLCGLGSGEDVALGYSGGWRLPDGSAVPDAGGWRQPDGAIRPVRLVVRQDVGAAAIRVTFDQGPRARVSGLAQAPRAIHSFGRLTSGRRETTLCL